MIDVSTVIDGRYRLQEQIGNGGAARVYRALDERVGLYVTVRVSHHPVRMLQSNAERQQELLSRIDDDRILKPLATGRLESGHAYGVYRFVDGESLDRIIARQRLTLPQALTVAATVAAAVSKVHAAGAIHRDIKPANMMVPVSGGVAQLDQSVLIDFGVYAWLKPGVGGHATEGGVVSGTATYMAPEQLTGRPEGVASDIYAVGAVLYELVFNAPLSHGDEVWLTAPLIGTERAFMGPLVTKRISLEATLPDDPNVPAEVRAIISRALRIDVAERHSSMSDLAAELSAWLNTKESTCEPLVLSITGGLHSK
jgi:eukaryotic-like serine/threonine-protein kinase